jgi:hypothetical protein
MISTNTPLIPFPTKIPWTGSITPVSLDINPLFPTSVISGSGITEKSLILNVTSELPRKFDPVKLCPKLYWTIPIRNKTKHLSFNLSIYLSPTINAGSNIM